MKSQGSTRESLLEFLSPCGVFKIICLNHLAFWYHKQKTPPRERDRLRNDPQLIPGFLGQYSGKLKGTTPKSFHACEFKKKSSKTYRALKIGVSVLLISCHNFLVTLSSVSLETCLTSSSVIPGTDIFCDWLFLVIFCVSLDTAANFRFFLSVANLLKGKAQQLGD